MYGFEIQIPDTDMVLYFISDCTPTLQLSNTSNRRDIMHEYMQTSKPYKYRFLSDVVLAHH